MKTFSDPHLIQREYYNPNKFDVEFTRMTEKEFYVMSTKGPDMLGPDKAVLKSENFLYLPHGYYIPTVKGFEKNEPFDLVVNVEKAMFIGNKKPSNPRGENS